VRLWLIFKYFLLTLTAGLVVFCTDDNQFFTYIEADSNWKAIACGTGKILPGAFGCGNPVIDSRDCKNYNTIIK
jgi:hypothetical protein